MQIPEFNVMATRASPLRLARPGCASDSSGIIVATFMPGTSLLRGLWQLSPPLNKGKRSCWRLKEKICHGSFPHRYYGSTA